MNTEEKESRATRASLELLFNISREVATALDLPAVLERVLFLSMRTIGANSGTIIVLDDNGIPVDSTIIYGTDVFGHTTHQLKETLDKGLAGWVVENRSAVLIPDTSKDERWVKRPDDAEDASGSKSAVSAPLLARERLVGVITLVQPEPNYFTEDHLALVQSIADQAGIAILNARLYQESQRQARVMTALAESAAIINGSLKVNDVINRILQQISQALNAEVVSLALAENKTNGLRFQASTNKKLNTIVGKYFKIGEGIAGWVAERGQGVIITKAQNDSRFSPEIDQIKDFETGSIVCAPIRSRGEILGILEALNPAEKKFDQDALLVMSGIGSLAGSAIRNAQLYEYLNAAQQRYHDLFEDSIDIILITDLQGNIVEANKQSTLKTGYSKDRLVGVNINELHNANPKVLGVNNENVRRNKTVTYESTLETKQGDIIPIQVISHIVIIDGEAHLQWIFRDITEEKNLNQMRDDLISMIYHDLRSPLNNIVSSFDVLSSMLNTESDSAINSILNIAIRSTERIQRLTNSLLDINRLEAGQPITNQQVTDPYQIIQDSADAVAPLIHNKNQRFITKIDDNIPHVIVDNDMIRRVLINLIENATKYSPAKSTITIGAKKEGAWVHIWVQDTGPGIPDKDKEHIFDKYTRLKNNQKHKGLGLGLAFCRLAIEGHGGRIWITDGDEGGSVFHITLPVASV